MDNVPIDNADQVDIELGSLGPLPETEQEFTKWVGAPNFKQAVAVTIRTSIENGQQTQRMFDQIKSVARELAEERKSLKRITEAADNAVECWLEGGSSQIFRNAIKNLNQVLTEEKP